MNIQTTRFGEIQVAQEDIIEFPCGILGFPDFRKYVMIPSGEGPLEWMQSVEVPDLAIVVCNPLVFKPDYTVNITEKELGEVRLKKAEDGVVLVIIVIPENPDEMTANLLGPLLLNPAERLGMQLILTHTEYSTKHRIVDAQGKKTGTG